MGKRRQLSGPGTVKAPAEQREAVVYARVSSTEQQEGFSIEAQLQAARAYALDRGFKIIQEFVDVESARKAGRKHFQEMNKLLRSHKTCRVVIAEKTDRLHRNLFDWGTLDSIMQEQDLAIHLFKEGVVLTRDDRSGDKFVQGIKALMARNYSDNLSEEVKKGLNEKLRQGHYPLRAPIGYVTDHATRHLNHDPEKAPVVRRLFELYATGSRSIADLHAVASEHGLKAFTSKGTITRAGIHDMLSNPIYHGWFVYKGQLHEGKHMPIVTKELFDKVQEIMAGRSGGTYQKRTFAFTGLLTCGACGCAITAELKKGKYTYYRCTTNRGGCTKKSVGEADLGEQLGAVLQALQLDDSMADTLRQALKESAADEAVYHEGMIATLKSQEDRLAGRLRQLYIDKLDTRVDDVTYDQLKVQWDKELAGVRAKLAAHAVADKKYLEFGMQLFELAQTAYSSYLQRSPAEKRELLNFVCSNCILVDGKVIPTYRKPFDLIASAPSMMEKRSEPDLSDPTRCQVKWALLDSNQ